MTDLDAFVASITLKIGKQVEDDQQTSQTRQGKATQEILAI